MDLPDFPTPPIVLDAQTLFDALIYAGGNANRHIALLEKLLETGQVYTMSRTRKDVKYEKESVWGKHNLDRLEVQNKNITIRSAVTLIIDECKTTGHDISSKSLVAKIDIIALARINGAKIVSTDSSKLPTSMKNLCGMFGVEFWCFTSMSKQMK